MMGRALGYHPDEPDARDFDVDRLELAGVDPAGVRVSMRLLAPPIYDQGRTSSCVAQSVAAAIEILERRAARQHPDFSLTGTPSRLFMYSNSRYIHAGGPAIFDTGTYLRTLVKGVARLGAPDENLWPFSTSPFTVNRRPAFVAYMRGHGRKGGQYFRILDTGSERVKAIQAALQEGYPVCFGTQVTNDFLKSDGPHVVPRPSTSAKFAGGHAMCILGFEKRPGGLVFEVRNSWGKRWRDQGHGWLTEDYIRWPRSSDFQIIKGWDRLRRAAG